MKTRRADYSLYELPELEEADFVFSVSPFSQIEDANDIGHIADSISIAMDIGDEFQMFDA